AFFRDAVADHDSEIVARMKRAGLVILGKTNTSEFGLSTSAEPRLFGPTRNPWNLEFTAGGSSGGAAAAVASGMLPMAHATDGGADPGQLRIAFTTKAWSGHPVDPECVTAVSQAAKLCENLGHSMEEASPVIDEELHNWARRIVIGANTRATLEARGKALGRE